MKDVELEVHTGRVEDQHISNCSGNAQSVEFLDVET